VNVVRGQHERLRGDCLWCVASSAFSTFNAQRSAAVGADLIKVCLVYGHSSVGATGTGTVPPIIFDLRLVSRVLYAY